MTSKLEKIRVSRGMSQRRLGNLTGVHQQTISRIESGGVLDKLSVAKKLAKALNCEPSDLIDVNPGFDILENENIKNLHNYIKATRELLDLNPRAASNLLNMEEKEYLDCESPNSELMLDEALTIAFIMLSDYIGRELSTSLKVKSSPVDVSDNEARALQELRALSPEDQEKFINLIKATPLIR